MESRTTRFRGEKRTTFESLSSSNFDLPRSYDSKKGQRQHQRKKEEPPGGYCTLLAVILFVLVIFGFVRYVDFRLPTPLSVADISDNPKSFIEERALYDLTILTSVGPRVAGSHANDITTIDSLTRIMQEISRTKLAIHNIEFEVQKPIGSFHMEFQDGLTSSYSNIPNFVVKFEPVNQKVNDSILVNCHFDSVPGSPGASDDMISCAVMLETIRVLSRQPNPLRNTIVFLFNGAEENLLQGAHGFIKGKVAGLDYVGHRWTGHLKCFLNLESAGAGAREILFQTGPGNSWLVESYMKVPYPWGSVVGEEIFQNGLIPSDTDFRIFRDFAKIPGLDMAFVKNGYVYHTKFDDVEHVTPGSLQHEGSNVLALLESLGNVDFSTTTYSNTKMVFFDVFGFFMIAYSEKAAVIFNLVLGFLVLAIAWNEDRKVGTMVRHVFSTLGAWVAGILSAAWLGLLLNMFQIYSPYHSYPMSAFVIFGVPCVVAQVLVYSWALKGSEDCSWIAGKTTLAVILILSTFFTRIVFSVTFNLLFGMIGWYVARMLFKGTSPVSPVSLGSSRRLTFYLVVGEAFPMALSLYLVAGCLDTFVPIMGRSGSDSNPNLFLALLTSFTLTVPTVTGIVPIFLFFKKSFLRTSALIMLILVAVLIFVVGKVPYGDKTPMRVHLIEVDRSYFEADLTTLKKRDAGFWLFNVDPNIPMFYDAMGENIPELKHKNHVEIDAYQCEDLYCGLPYIFPVKKLIRKSHWIAKETSLPESMTSRLRMDITEDTFITNDVRRVTFSFVGPDHLTINFSPGANYDFSKWSLTDKIPAPHSMLWKGRPTYFVYHARGIAFERFNVTIDFKRKDVVNPKSSDPLVDINFSSFYLHGDEMKSPDMLNFIKSLPSWTYVLGFTGVSHVYSVPE